MSFLDEYLKNEQNRILKIQNEISAYKNTIGQLLEFIIDNGLLNSKILRTVSSDGELYCKIFLRKEFPKYKFMKVRPSWLKNPKTGHRMELDFYCSKLKLAIEFNGKQHYEYTPYFHGDKKNFKEQVDRDKAKLKLCKKQGVHLIVIRECEELREKIKHYKSKIMSKIKEMSDSEESEDEDSEDKENELEEDSSESYDGNNVDLEIFAFKKLIKHKPKWYVTDKYLDKEYVRKKIVLMLGYDIHKNVFWRKLKNTLVLKEKNASDGGNRQRLILLKSLW